MCGRYNVLTSAQGFVDLLDLLVEIGSVGAAGPRYNGAPTQLLPVVRRFPDAMSARIDDLKWGLVPSWAKDPGIGNRMINARMETAAEKPAYRVPYRRRRCLVAADGWYEWRRSADGKQPWMIRRRDGEPFFIAGLWESWRGKGRDADAPALETFTLLTGDASAQLARIHARMPVVLDRGLYEQWLDPRMTDPQALCEVLDARPLDVFEVWPVSRYVNSPANDSARCLERIPDPERS